MHKFRSRFLFCAAWGIAVGAGLWSMVHFEITPAAVGHPPKNWPPVSTLHLNSYHPTLIMFVHPKCPCSRASLDELAVLVTHCSGQLSLIVVFFKPRGFDDDWEKTDLWRTAGSIPGTTLVCDNDGMEAARFCAGVSGETLLYDRDGGLLFHGGFTPSRGHRGDNAGRSSVELLLAGLPSPDRQTPVFGCSLHDPAGADPELLRPMNPRDLQNEESR